MKAFKTVHVQLIFTAVTATLLLTGCGLAETTAVAAAEAEAAQKQVKEGKKLEEKVQHDVEAANQVAADARAKVDEEN